MAVFGFAHFLNLALGQFEQLVASREASGNELNQAGVPRCGTVGRRIESQPLLVPEGCGGCRHGQLDSCVLLLRFQIRQFEQSPRVYRGFESISADHRTQAKLIEEEADFGDGHRPKARGEVDAVIEQRE